MRFIIPGIILFLTSQVSAQSYQTVHKNAILVDTHNDILTQTMEKGLVIDKNLKGQTHSDLKRLKKGGVDVQFFSVWCDGEKADPFSFAIRQMDSLDAVIKRNPRKIIGISSTDEITRGTNRKKIRAFFGIEGGHMIQDDLDNLPYLYDRGVRYITLTWNNSTAWATSASDETYNENLRHKGLSDFGKEVVHRMNELGIMVDVSHVGEQTFWDVINTTSKPILASHSSVYRICPHPRNLKDDQIKAIAKNGGVIQVNFYSGFLDSAYRKKTDIFMQLHQAEYDSLVKAGTNVYIAEETLFSKYEDEVQSFRAPLSLLLQHIEYIIDLAGIDHVGLGSDFDGIESSPQQLDDVTSYPIITKALMQRGYKKDDIDKILGGNVIRVLEANEKL